MRERKKLSVLVVSMIVNVENSKESTDKLLELIRVKQGCFMEKSMCVCVSCISKHQ